MPTYHFRCRACKKETPIKMLFGSTDLPICDTCKAPMEKFIVPPMVHFKGGGFYKNDNASPVQKTDTPTSVAEPKKTADPPKTPDPSPKAS